MATFYYTIACDEAAKPRFFSVQAELVTLDEAKNICAAFPKYLKLKALTNSSNTGLVSMRVDMGSDGVTGTANEGGLKRISKFFEAAKRLGFDVQQKEGSANLTAQEYGWAK